MEIRDGKIHDENKLLPPIANRATEILGGKKSDYSVVNPNDHVNCGQSTNDVIPTVGKMTSLCLLKKLKKQLLHLSSALEQKAKEFDGVIKFSGENLVGLPLG